VTQNAFLDTKQGIDLIYAAENESNVRSLVVRAGQARSRLNGGKFGPIPYGWRRRTDPDLKIKVEEEDPFQQNVLKFIRAARDNTMTPEELWNLIRQLKGKADMPMSKKFKNLPETGLSPNDIAILLNKQKIENRYGDEWTENQVSNLLNRKINKQPVSSLPSSLPSLPSLPCSTKETKRTVDSDTDDSSSSDSENENEEEEDEEELPPKKRRSQWKEVDESSDEEEEDEEKKKRGKEKEKKEKDELPKGPHKSSPKLPVTEMEKDLLHGLSKVNLNNK
jgi:hypothetical protein